MGGAERDRGTTDAGATDAGAAEPRDGASSGVGTGGAAESRTEGADGGSRAAGPRVGRSGAGSSGARWSGAAASDVPPSGAASNVPPPGAPRSPAPRPSARRRPTFATVPPAVPVGATHGPVEPALFRFLDEARRSVSGRVVLALVGWVPIGIVLAVVLGESTGCIRYAAECQGPFGAATLIGQGSVVALLLLLPRLAAVATLGTIGMLAAAIPAAAVLSISGGAGDPAGATPTFVAVLALAWMVGIGVGLARAGVLAASARRPPVP